MILRKVFINNINESLQLVQKVGCSKSVCVPLAKKGISNTILINKMNNKGLNILKQEAISVGADVAVNENVSKFKCGMSNAVLFANSSQITKLINKLSLQPFGLQEFALKLKKILNTKIVFQCKNKCFNLEYPVIMGVISNILDPQKALKRAIIFKKLGVNILSIETHSSNLYDSTTEIKILSPILKIIRKYVPIPISIYTYKYKTAKFALNEGADIIHDVFALNKGCKKLAILISQQKAGLILVYSKDMTKMNSTDYIYKVYDFFIKRKQYAMKFGIEEQYIAVDLGFSLTTNIAHTIKLMKSINMFSSLGAVVGTVSNKRESMLNPFFKNHQTTSIIENLLILLYGGNIIKVHDVKTTTNIINFLKVLQKI
ncbi:MAG: dihydropteroate synthase [Endomicrobium sp.]|nr:dihydropteroate synthase [Endomicrobium sp.]